MPSNNGPVQANGQLQWDWSIGGISKGSTTVPLTMGVFFRSVAPASQFFNGTKSWEGTWGSGSSAQAFNLNSDQRVLLLAVPITVTLTDSPQTFSFSMGTTHFWGNTVGTQSVTVGPRFARTPTSVSVSRNTDKSHTISWTRNSTYTAVVVQRSTNNSTWSQVGRPAGNAASFTDTTTVANQRYYYRVAGVGGAGQSSWSSSTAAVYTTPAAPKSVTATRVSDTQIRVAAAGLPAYATSYDIEDDGSIVATSVTLPWSHGSPSTLVPHQYRVRAKRGSLVSGFSPLSNVVQLLAPPNAPTGLSPNGKTSPSDADVAFLWTHNPVDTSPQTAYELRYRVPGDSWTTLTGTTLSSRSIALDVGSFEWQVRTKGEYPAFGPWSATASVTVIDRPGVAILAPIGVIAVTDAAIEWTWHQGQERPQSAWRAQLMRDLALVEAGAGSGAATEHLFNAPLVNDSTYTVRVQAATGDLWSEWAEETFTTSFPPPAPPELNVVWDESTGQHSLSVHPGALAEYAWTGDVNESPSTMTVDGAVTTNLVTNPLMSGDVIGWVATAGAITWEDGLSVTLYAGEGVYIDFGVAADPVVSARALVDGSGPYRLALFDPTGTSFAHWAPESIGEVDVLMENLTVEVGKPMRLYVGMELGGTLRMNNVAVTPGISASVAFDGNTRDNVETEYMTVERSIDGVTWEPVAAALVGDSIIADGEGKSYGSTWYRATGISDINSAASTVVEVVSDSDALWLSGGVGFAVAARLPYSPKVGIDAGRARSVQRYEGRPLGVAYAGEQISRTVSASGSVLDDDVDTAQVEQLTVLAQIETETHLYRDPDGRRIYGVLSSVSLPRESSNVWGYSFALEETGY